MIHQQTSHRNRRRWNWRRVIVCLAVLTVSMSAVLFLFGVRTETNYTCPLTGHDRIIVDWVGVRMSDRVIPNEVSAWSTRHGLADVGPGQCGWDLASTVTIRWFSPARFGCGRPLMIPNRLYHRSITAVASSPESALQQYQKALIAAFAADRPLAAAQQHFLDTATK